MKRLPLVATVVASVVVCAFALMAQRAAVAPPYSHSECAEWNDTNIVDCVALAPGRYSFSNANFDGGLVLKPGRYAIDTGDAASTNSAAFIHADGADVALVGKGCLSIVADGASEPSVTAHDLTLSGGVLSIGFSPAKGVSKISAVLLSGNFTLCDKGRVSMTLGGEQPYGIQLEGKDKSAAMLGGGFVATLRGTKASALKVKRSAKVVLGGGTMTAALEGFGAKVVNGGTVTFENGFSCNIVGAESAEKAMVFVADKTMEINGGTFDINVPAPGSEVFVTDNDPGKPGSSISIRDGRFDIVSGDDCVNAVTDVVISGGYFHGVSLHGDVIDANADMAISGGRIVAYTTAVEDDGNGSVGLDVNKGHTIDITGGTVIAIGGPHSKFKGVPSNAYCDNSVDATGLAGKYIQFSGITGGTPTLVKERLPESLPSEISLFLYTPGLDRPPVIQ